MIVKINEELTQLDQQAVKEELALLNAALNNWPVEWSFQQNIPSEGVGSEVLFVDSLPTLFR